MSNNPNLLLRLSPPDKAALVELSQRLDLSQTDIVRLLVREKLGVLKEHDGQADQAPLIIIRPMSSPA